MSRDVTSRSYEPEHLIGYLEELSVRPGDVLHAKISGKPALVEVALVRSAGAAFAEVPGAARATFTAREQPLCPGSYALIEHFPAVADLHLTIEFCPTRESGTVHGTQALIGTWDRSAGVGWALSIDRGLLTLHLAGYQCQMATPVIRWRWHRARASYLAGTGVATLAMVTLANSAVTEPPRTATCELPLPSALLAGCPARPLVIGAMLDRGTPTAHFDGKIARPRIGSHVTDQHGPGLDPPPLSGPVPTGLLTAWDFSQDVGGDRIIDTGPLQLHGTVVQQPARAVTGSAWDGSANCYRENPSHYDAIHFHSDDLIDAGWATDVSYALPDTIPSGIYGLRLQSVAHEDVIPFYVRAPESSRRAAVCFLASTSTYLAYGNPRLDKGGFAGLATQPADLPAGHRWASTHPEAGPSLYEPHADGSGTFYASRHRPIADWRLGSSAWGFQADLSITGWLEATWPDFDVVTDEDLHRDGGDALAGYRVLVTGAHPEYWSTTMLNALEQWLDRGGRLMYLGGNGFYWRIAYHPCRPGIIEVRRAEDGTRAWISDPGEYYHSFTGEFGGLWRRVGQPPNRLVGVGFAAQGFGAGRPYRIQPGVTEDSRTAWIFAGLAGRDLLGERDEGNAGVAAVEIDRHDVRLGSPWHSVVLASAASFDDRMLRAKEECFATGAPPRDHGVRCDLTFFETVRGGAVFSTGSVAWSDGLAERESDVSVMTRNVLLRFANDDPFYLPAGGCVPDCGV